MMEEIAQGTLNTLYPGFKGVVSDTSEFLYECGCFIENGGFHLRTGLHVFSLVTRSQASVAKDCVSKRVKNKSGLRAECKKGVALDFTSNR